MNSTTDTTTSNSTVLEGIVPSDDNYCVTVTATDYTTRTSDQSCFRFNGKYNNILLNSLLSISFYCIDPPAVNNLIVTNIS